MKATKVEYKPQLKPAPAPCPHLCPRCHEPRQLVEITERALHGMRVRRYVCQRCDPWRAPKAVA